MIGRTNSSSMNSTTDVLDFTVVDGLTEPVNPKEKMIWIATDEEITSWAFSATEPAAQQGLVWFLVGQSSSVAFSVTKDNPIIIYPIKAQQYINNSWVEKTTKIYLNNNWVKWNNITYWFKAGEGPTNTWNTKGANNGSAYIDSGKIIVRYPWYYQESSAVRISSASKINLTNFNKIYFDVEPDTKAGDLNNFFGVASALSESDLGVTWEKYISLTEVNRMILELDVNDLQGDYYIVISGNGNNSRTLYVYNIYGS